VANFMDIRLKNIKAVLFDVDDTLVATSEIHAQAFKSVLAKHGRNEFWYENYLGYKTHEVFVDLGFSNQMASKLQVEKQELARRALRTANPMPGALEIVDLLVKEKVGIAAVSSGSRESVEVSLSAVGLLDKFPLIVSGSDIEQGKPSPEGYLQALSKLQIEPWSCIAVEDSSVGCIAAKSAGILVVGIGSKPLPSDAQFTTLSDFIQHLQMES